MYLPIGQFALAATTETAVVDGTSREPLQIKIVICNRDSASATFRVSLAVAGLTTANKQYLSYDDAINGNRTVELPYTIGVNSGDKVNMYASSANLSVNVFAEKEI